MLLGPALVSNLRPSNIKCEKAADDKVIRTTENALNGKLRPDMFKSSKQHPDTDHFRQTSLS